MEEKVKFLVQNRRKKYFYLQKKCPPENYLKWIKKSLDSPMQLCFYYYYLVKKTQQSFILVLS